MAEKEGRRLYLAGRRNPLAHPENQVAVLGKIISNAPIFIVGMGNLHYFEELDNNADESVQVLLYEPLFPIFYRQLYLADFEKLMGKRTVALVVGGINDDGLDSIIGAMLRGDRVPLMKYFVLPNYIELCLGRIEGFLKILREHSKSYFTSLGTKMFFRNDIADNFYNNVRYVRTGYKAFQLLNVIPTDIPAFIVSAGPSLNKNIKELKRAKNKSFIIAVDTAIKPLVKEGILPDMFATLDGIKPVELVEQEEAKGIPLLTKLTATKGMLDYHTGKKFFINEGFRYANKLFEINQKSIEGFPVGGSVATLAFSMVCHLGFRKIIFVGQDLAYTDNKSHADGTFQEKMPEENTEDFIMVPGNYKEEVPTLSNLDGYRKWFGEFIKQWEKGHYVEFINATEGGARIEGTVLMSLADVIDKECTKEVDIKSYIDGLEPIFNKDEQLRIRGYFHETPKQIYEIVRLAQEGKKIYQQLDKLCCNGNMDRRAYQKILKRVKKNRKEIEGNVHFDLLLNSMVTAEQIIRSGQFFKYGTMEEEGRELARQGKEYMKLLEGYAKVLRQIAEETVAKVE
ncbi:MAG: motility associated factor glycosyltransferase family protein [Lachnospiraceae bacterium]|nr:motility associated factor glycosyltransferase family protein [Lachnospiraceae bacterium]